MKIKNNSGFKKYFIVAFVFIFVVALSGCGSKKTVDMNELGANEKYNYENKNMGFAIQFPKEFIYFQTQRKDAADYTDLEFFVPTSDMKYVQEIPGYGKPVVVRVFKKDAFSENTDKAYKKIGEKGDSVYTVKFWDKAPADWQAKWNDNMKSEIEKSLRF